MRYSDFGAPREHLDARVNEEFGLLGMNRSVGEGTALRLPPRNFPKVFPSRE
jgi:hypothetical protein